MPDLFISQRKVLTVEQTQHYFTVAARACGIATSLQQEHVEMLPS